MSLPNTIAEYEQWMVANSLRPVKEHYVTMCARINGNAGILRNVIIYYCLKRLAVRTRNDFVVGQTVFAVTGASNIVSTPNFGTQFLSSSCDLVDGVHFKRIVPGDAITHVHQFDATGFGSSALVTGPEWVTRPTSVIHCLMRGKSRDFANVKCFIRECKMRYSELFPQIHVDQPAAPPALEEVPVSARTETVDRAHTEATDHVQRAEVRIVEQLTASLERANARETELKKMLARAEAECNVLKDTCNRLEAELHDMKVNALLASTASE
jgi:hypothetical protein